MEMDCYSEYKHHIHPNHQHYGGNVVANHPYYGGNYGPSSMRYSHAHSPYGENGQQQNYFDGYTRYNHAQLQHHHHHHHNSNGGNFPSSYNGHYGAVRENYHTHNETNGQYYYHQNAHQTSASYYTNHPYESYRNSPTNYQYHHHYGSSVNGGNYGQTALHPTQYYSSSYNNSPTEQFNNRYYPTPPPSVPPSTPQRDPYSVAHSGTGTGTGGEGTSQTYAPLIENESSEKMNNESLMSNENDKRYLTDVTSASSSSSMSSPPAIKQIMESQENIDDDKKRDDEQTESVQLSSNDKTTVKETFNEMENGNENEKVKENLDSNDKELKDENQESSSVHFTENGNNSQCNESLTKSNVTSSQESTTTTVGSESLMATDYHCQQAARESQNNRHRKSLREKDKCLKGSNINRKSFEISPNFVFMDSAGDVIEREYFYGLSQFQDSLEAIQSEISVAEIDFLSQWKNLITIYEENLSTLSKQLFENHGFIVDAKHVYLFVLQVKNRIKDEMKRLMENFTSDNINESLTETYQSFINNLRKISEKEILKFQDPNKRNDDDMLLECWDSFKILLLDLGLNTINDLKSSSLAERENLMKNIYEVSQDASSNYDKLIDVLSKSHFKSSTPLSINTYTNDPFNRCSTPFANMTSSSFNHGHIPPHNYPPHQRLPPNFPHAAAAHNYWYSQQHQPPHHNWMMNPYMRNRRGSYTDAQMLPSSVPFNRNIQNEKHKLYEDSSPPPKRKRKAKSDTPPKNDPKDELMKNITPLPGFLQTFGGTEIGRFSEAFFTSSESPNPYYNNSIESDVESPQPWDFDSLDGPINMQAAFQVYGSETEHDSPINNFSELICNEY